MLTSPNSGLLYYKPLSNSAPVPIVYTVFYNDITAYTSSIKETSRGSCPELDTVPLCNLLLEHLVDQFMLLDDSQAFEPGRLDLDGIHGAAAAANVLNLSGQGQRGIHTTCFVRRLQCYCRGACDALIGLLHHRLSSRSARRADG